MITFSDEEKHECAAREVKMRKRVYPRWIEDGRMKKADADREIAIMQEIAADYRSKGELAL